MFHFRNCTQYLITLGFSSMLLACGGGDSASPTATTYTVSTLAGTAGVVGYADGTGPDAQFDYPFGLSSDGSGNVYLGDAHNQVIRKITPQGVVTTYAGTAGVSGSIDAGLLNSTFYNPASIAFDGSGNLIVADSGSSIIRKITPQGVVSTLAGLPGNAGAIDGNPTQATFNMPFAVAADGIGNVYVADTGNKVIRKIDTNGNVTTFAGSAGVEGTSDGTGSQASFVSPQFIAVDQTGNVYVADSGGATIRKITSSGVVSTLAGSPGVTGATDGTGSNALFNYPTGIAVDSQGNVFVADYLNHNVRKITPAGVVTTIAGVAGSSGSEDGPASTAKFNSPRGLSLDLSGSIYVVDGENSTIRKITPNP